MLASQEFGRLGRLSSLLSILLPLALLAGCLQSQTPLLTDADYVQPMPDEFTVFGYTAKDGVFKLNVEDDGTLRKTQFARAGAGYQPVGETGGMYFMANGENSYLVAITDTSGTYYGFAEIKGQLLLSNFISAEPEKDLARIRDAADDSGRATLEAVTFKDGGFQIESREALLFLAERVRSGDLVLQGGPFYWLPGLVDGTDPGTAPPAALDAQGNPVSAG
jgi:hypothetical protein